MRRISRNRRSRKQTAQLTAVCGLFATSISNVMALDHTYAGPANGSWNNPTYWQPTGVPGNGDGAVFQNADSTNRNILLDISVGTLTTLRIGNSGSGVTTLNQNAGVNLTANVEVVGQGNFTGSVSGNAVHIQNGGLNTYTNFLSVGAGSGSQTGTYTLSAGSMNFTGAGGSGGSPGLYVGTNENGVFNDNAGTINLGSISAPVPLYVGYQASGTYNMNAGAQQLNIFGDFRLGDHGNGTFIQNGGTVNDTGTNGLFIASFDSPNTGTTDGYYELDNGTLAVSNGEILGANYGNATFDQNGGLNTTSTVFLGDGPNTNGFYQLSGGTLLVSGDERYSFSGSGSFAQSGGVHVIGSASAPATVTIGSIHSSEYSLSNTGSLTVFGKVIDGLDGPGDYDQTGGAATVHGNFYVGGSDTAPTNQSCTLNLSAGSLTITGTLKAWNGEGSLGGGGTVSFSGGTLSVGSLDVTGNSANFKWTAGTLIFTGPSRLDSTSPLGSVSSINGVLVNLSVMTLAGSTTGPGLLINQNLLTGSGTLGGAGGVLNSGVLTPAAGSSIVVTNTGSFNNTGNIELPATTLFQLAGGSFNNNGQVTLDGGLLAGATITNNSELQGHGNVSNSVLNNGIIDAISGTMILTGSVTNNGQIVAETGGKISLQSPPNANTGSIQLLGGEFDTNNQSFINSPIGKITGHGTFRSGGLINNGSILFSGDATDVFGPITNTGSITITGANTTTFYNNITTTAGSMTVNANSTAVFLGSVSGQSNITGPGTKDFEGASSGGAINSITGSTIVGPAANVTADFFHENSLSITGKATVSPTASPNTNISIIKSLYIDPAAKFDLGNNSLIIDYTTTSPLPTIAAYIKSAYAAGSWTDPGLTSSAAFANHKTALGYAEASALGISTFDGQPIDSTTLLTAYTYYGDANLDGTVNALDFNSLATNYGRSNGNEVWAQGDFNYDGTVNSSDFAMLAANYGQTIPSSAAAPLGAIVPEPALIGFLCLGLAASLRLRRRASRTNMTNH